MLVFKQFQFTVTSIVRRKKKILKISLCSTEKRKSYRFGRIHPKILFLVIFTHSDEKKAECFMLIPSAEGLKTHSQIVLRSKKGESMRHINDTTRQCLKMWNGQWDQNLTPYQFQLSCGLKIWKLHKSQTVCLWCLCCIVWKSLKKVFNVFGITCTVNETLSELSLQIEQVGSIPSVLTLLIHTCL